MLTDTAIRNAKFKEKQFKLSDEKGMYVLVCDKTESTNTGGIW